MQWSRDGIYLVYDVYGHPSYNRNPYNGCIKSILYSPLLTIPQYMFPNLRFDYDTYFF